MPWIFDFSFLFLSLFFFLPSSVQNYRFKDQIDLLKNSTKCIYVFKKEKASKTVFFFFIFFLPWTYETLYRYLYISKKSPSKWEKRQTSLTLLIWTIKKEKKSIKVNFHYSCRFSFFFLLNRRYRLYRGVMYMSFFLARISTV